MKRALLAAAAALVLVLAPGAHARAGASPVAPVRKHVLPTVETRETAKDCVPPAVVAVACTGSGIPMEYGEGPVQTGAVVYVVHWGWTAGTDPVAARQVELFQHVGATPWNGSQTQYCDATTDLLGTVCASGANHVGNRVANVLAGTWDDTTNPIPANFGDTDVANEAARAAAHFAVSGSNVQIVVDTPHNKSESGFATQWCAWHGATTNNISFTYFPYMPDAGASCGAGSVRDALDGVTIVGGHEFAESETDPQLLAWSDLVGEETADKCAWINIGSGAAAETQLNGVVEPMQPLWSNSANGGNGACVYAG